MLFNHGPNKAFLVFHSCRSTLRNGSSINADVIEDTNDNDQKYTRFCYFKSNLPSVLNFLALQHKHNYFMHTFSLTNYLHQLRKRLENIAKDSLFYLFLKFVQTIFIFQANSRIVVNIQQKNNCPLLRCFVILRGIIDPAI